MDAVIKFSDAMILALVFPNMIGLFFLYPIVKKELQSFFKAIEESWKKQDNDLLPFDIPQPRKEG